MSTTFAALYVPVGAESDPTLVQVREVHRQLGQLQAMVGGWLEGVTPAVSPWPWSAYCNEEGKIQGQPVNVLATILAHLGGWPRGDVLCGPVVFMGLPGPDGEETDVSPQMLEVLERVQARLASHPYSL